MGRRRLDPFDVKRRRVLYVSDRDWPAVERAVAAAAERIDVPSGFVGIRCEGCGRHRAIPRDGSPDTCAACGMMTFAVRPWIGPATS